MFPLRLLYQYVIVSVFTVFSGTSDDHVINLKTSQGSILSPDADSDGLYDSSIDIMWIIETAEGEIIRYKLLFAMITNSDQCQSDGLKVHVCPF